MTQSNKQVNQVNNSYHSDGKAYHASQMMSAGTPKVKEFIIPETPRTEESSRHGGTPQKYKSPNSMVRDLTQQMMDSNMKSPLKDALNAPVNPQSQNNSKRK